MFTGKFPSNGEFAYPWFDLYWNEPDSRWPFWAKSNGEIAGLALIRRDEGDGRMEMSEFYIRPSWRRRRVGLQFARTLCRRFPGSWKINQSVSNAGAVKFWHCVLDGWVDYIETSFVSDVPRLEQRFVVEA
jgi:predicted acetyltransferase